MLLTYQIIHVHLEDEITALVHASIAWLHGSPGRPAPSYFATDIVRCSTFGCETSSDLLEVWILLTSRFPRSPNTLSMVLHLGLPMAYQISLRYVWLCCLEDVWCSYED